MYTCQAALDSLSRRFATSPCKATRRSDRHTSPVFCVDSLTGEVRRIRSVFECSLRVRLPALYIFWTVSLCGLDPFRLHLRGSCLDPLHPSLSASRLDPLDPVPVSLALLYTQQALHLTSPSHLPGPVRDLLLYLQMHISLGTAGDPNLASDPPYGWMMFVSVRR